MGLKDQGPHVFKLYNLRGVYESWNDLSIDRLVNPVRIT